MLSDFTVTRRADAITFLFSFLAQKIIIGNAVFCMCNCGDGLSVRKLIAIVSLLVGPLVSASCIQAQSLPWNLALDSSFRTELLFGSQAIRDNSSPGTAEARFRIDSDFRLPVLSGTIEITPLTYLSGRIVGETGVLEQQGTVRRNASSYDIGGADVIEIHATPNFSGWEAAGLLNLWNDGGYRFSFTAGYRAEFWGSHGDGVGLFTGVSSAVREDFSSRCPFLGLQTAVFFPWWKARFEVIGSPWITKNGSGSVSRTNYFAEYQIKTSGGSLLELQVEGTMALRQYIFAGLHGRYTFREGVGGFTNTGHPVPMSLYTNDSFAFIGLDLTVAF